MKTKRYALYFGIGAALLATVLLAVFSGKGEPGAPSPAGGQSDGYFTEDDRNGDWDTSGATVITLMGTDGKVQGDGAHFADGNVYITSAGKYLVSGPLTDGSLIVDTADEGGVWLSLQGIDLHAEDDAALLVRQAEKVFLTLAGGTENRISSGETYADSAVSDGIDGAIYSRDSLTVNGSGALSVTAGFKHGIVCNDDLVVTGGTLDVTAPQDTVHANDSFRFTDADLSLSAGDDAVTVENDDRSDFIYLAGGALTVSSSYEGLEAATVTVAGGSVDITSTDDGINAEKLIEITGGDTRVVNDGGTDADGLDSNGDIRIAGGKLFVSVPGEGPNSALDYGEENGGTCRIDGGTVIACGGCQMQKEISKDSRQAFLLRRMTGEAGSPLILQTTGGTVLVSEVIPCSFTSVIISTPDMVLKTDYILIAGNQMLAFVADNTSEIGEPDKTPPELIGDPRKPSPHEGENEPPTQPSGDELPPMPDGNKHIQPGGSEGAQAGPGGEREERKGPPSPERTEEAVTEEP